MLQYVKRGLEVTGKERRKTQTVGATGGLASTTVRGSESQAMLSKLNSMRAGFGWDPVSGVRAGDPASLPKVVGVTEKRAMRAEDLKPGSTATFTKAPAKAKPKIAASELSAIKQRLAKVKAGQMD